MIKKIRRVSKRKWQSRKRRRSDEDTEAESRTRHIAKSGANSDKVHS
nr:hypothetical protein [Mycoplasmopsis bovis]